MKPSIETAIICGVCGVRKGQENHWLFVAISGGRVTFAPLRLPDDESALRREGHSAIHAKCAPAAIAELVAQITSGSGQKSEKYHREEDTRWPDED